MASPALAAPPTPGRVRVFSVVSLVSSGGLLLAALLPWMSFTFIVSLTVRGAATTEGRIALAAAAVGVGFAVTALATGRAAALLVTAAAGGVALLTGAVCALRLDDVFASSISGREAEQIEDLVGGAVRLDAGWFLAMISAAVMLLAGLSAGYRADRRPTGSA